MDDSTETSDTQEDTKAVDSDVTSTTDFEDNNGGILELLNTIYNDRYYWEILKSAVMFILALKVARECNMMRIPMKEYKPFQRN